MFKRPKGTKPQPKNTRAVGVARKTIEHLMPVAQRTLQNALTGDGRHCLLYIIKDSGIKCSCMIQDPLDSNGQLRPDMMIDILSLNQETDYKSGIGVKNNPTNVSNSNPEHPSKEQRGSSRNISKQDYKTKVFSLEDLEGDGFNPDTALPNIDLAFNEKRTPQDIPTLRNGFVPTTSISTTSCPICMGTTWVGGYDLYGGTRLILQASSANSLIGCTYVSSSPSYLECVEGSKFSYTDILLPAGANRLDEISVWNSRERIPFNVIVDGVELSNPLDLRSYFDGKYHKLEFTPLVNSNITHVVLQYGMSDILIDVSKKSISTQNTVYDQQSEVSLVLPAITDKDLKGSIVYDSTDGKLYRISSTNTSTSADGWIQNIDVDARIVQPYELTTQLPKLGTKINKKFGGSFANTSKRPRNF